jgi:hypothetical protein
VGNGREKRGESIEAQNAGGGYMGVVRTGGKNVEPVEVAEIYLS